MTASKIEWTDRSDWNPVRGCTRVSPGCGGPGPHGGCYAEAMAARFSKPGQWGHGFAEMRDGKPRWTGKIAVAEDRLTLPLHWRKPAKVFASSTNDIFHEALSDHDIDRIFAVMALCRHLTFQVLTKRAERMRAYFATQPNARRRWETIIRNDHGRGTATVPLILPNVWLGVSVEDQERANERIPHLLQTPAAIRFLSCEPLLGPIDLDRVYFGDGIHMSALHGGRHTPSPWHIDWVIAGGESGPRARAMLAKWLHMLRDQCIAAGIPFFFKQWGEWIDADQWLRRLRDSGAEILLNGDPAMLSSPLNYADAAIVAGIANDRFEHQSHGSTMIRVGRKRSGHSLDGRTFQQFPESKARAA